jgi:MinD superfamily P-loop ATPase
MQAFPAWSRARRVEGAMKQLVILSGKGGAGKTSVAAGVVHLASTGREPHPLVIADADVDAANLELVLNPVRRERSVFWGGQEAVINPELCNGCGVCASVCRFDAVLQDGGQFQIDPLSCEGCAACFYHCPQEAIQMVPQQAGQWFRSDTRFGALFHAALRPGAENSGKLVDLIKQRARDHALVSEVDLLVVDGPPGIGCPVIAAISGADLILIVAEPTLAGQHDMQRVLAVVRHFGLTPLVCINKADIYPEGAQEIKTFCADRGVTLLGEIPYDVTVTNAMAQGQPVTAYRPNAPASRALREVWDGLKMELNGHL